MEKKIVEEKVEAISETAFDSRKNKSRKKRIETQEEKPQSEWTERVVQIRRVTKVVKGGKKLSFRAIVIVGNQKGQVGVGCAKAAEVIKHSSIPNLDIIVATVDLSGAELEIIGKNNREFILKNKIALVE